MSRNKTFFDVVTGLIASNNIPKLEKLIASNPTICDTLRRFDNMSLLNWTIVNDGSVEIVLSVLKNTSTETINERFLGNTALGKVCEGRYDWKKAPTIVKALLEHGADPTIGDIYNNNMTPSQVAESKWLVGICKIFDPKFGSAPASDCWGDSRR
jgi:hypothetical protein